MVEKNREAAEEQSLRRQFEELEKRAARDELSGLLNRAAAEQYIASRLEEMRAGESCALFIVDLDDFKRVNDTLGHQAGDQAIRRSAQILSGLFHAKDIVARLGGDEFIAFMSGRITEQAAREQGSAICRELQLSLGSSPAVSVTASVGVYYAGSGGQRFDSLYQSADLALYRAKKGGKHSCCLKHDRESPVSGEEFRPVNTIPLSGLLEYMDSGVALLEMGEPINLIYVSPSFCRILGTDPQTYVTPRRLSELVHPDDLLELERVLRKGVREEQAVEHTHRVSRDGAQWRWWHVRAVRITYNNPYPVMLVTTTDISRFKTNERRLEEINQRLQIALDQTTQSLWEVDLSSRCFRMFNHTGQPVHEAQAEGARFPEWLLENGLIHPDSVPRFREFAQQLLSGRVQGFGNFIVQNLDTGCYGWAAVSYRMALDETGRATRAVGILENLPQNFVAQETRSVLRRPLPEALRADLVMGLRANLTQDTVLDLWVEGKNQSASLRDAACGRCLARAAESLYSAEERRRCAHLFSPGELLERFRQGERWLWTEYRRVGADGGIQWVSHIANLVEDPLTRDVYLFLYLCSLDARKRWEHAAKGETLRDGETRLYTRQAARAMAQALLARAGAEECAVAVIDLGGLGRRLAGDAAALERSRFCLAAAFTVALGVTPILARYSADQILAVIPRAAPAHELRSQLEGAFSFVRLVLSGAVELQGVRFVAGVVRAPAAGANISAMAAQAVSLCRLWHNASADTVAFPHEGDVWDWDRLQEGIGDGRVSVHHSEMDRPLSEGEKDVAFQCMSAMLSADTLEASVQGVLSYIGDYYRADRVYILTLAANGHVITMPYEWTDGKKTSIQQAVSGTMISRYPLLQRCLKERAPVFLARENPISLQGEPPVEESWYFTAFPLAEHESISGFLCIENAREHPADAALFSTLIPYILREKERYRTRGAAPGEPPVASPLDLPNLRTYMEVIYTLDSDRYSSMGAVYLDIPDLSSINSSLGFEYGSRLLWYVSKTLADVFGPGWIFRTWDAEFVAICPNTTRQIFEGRCARLRSLLRRRYPRELRIGCAWADGTFQARELVSEAKSLLQGEERAGAGEISTQIGSPEQGDAPSWRFTVFLQPKVDMSTGALYGAEALVRGIDEDGTVVLPGAFIPQLERSGGIRELDLFVLERVLALLERWREQGLGAVPVSVNLSRVTLLSPTALASVLAIQSRYPAVPPDALELEVTESVGGETGTLQAVIDQFRQCGLRLGLDDFGSKYANLSVFTNVHFDTVKLDRTLIAGLVGNPINHMLVQDIVRICQTCGTACVAEGVETQAQASALMEAGCRYAQGYYYDRPMPAELFEQKYLRGAAQIRHELNTEEERT